MIENKEKRMERVRMGGAQDMEPVQLDWTYSTDAYRALSLHVQT